MNIDRDQQMSFDIETFIGRSVAVLGITGSGKTNTAAVLIEELLTNGLPLTIVDIEGEYWGLKEQFDILVAGRSAHAELPVSVENAHTLAELSIKRGISVILDISDFTKEEAHQLLIAYFKSLWAASTATRQPYQIVLEEAHEFVPQGIGTPLKELLTRIALRGRKRGLGIIMMSQRSAKVEKDVLTQTSLLFLHKVVHPIDVRVYKDLIPLPATQVSEMVGKLHPGEAVVVYNHEARVAHVRVRHTFHAGSTPTFGEDGPPALRHIDTALLQELQRALAASSRRPDDDEGKLTRRVREMEAQLAERDAEITRLREQVALLSKLTVSLEGQTDSTSLASITSIPKMEIEQATIARLDVPLPIAQTRIVEATPVSVALPVQTRPLHFSQRDVDERKFHALSNKFHRASSLEKRILRVLIEQGKPLTVSDIAFWLDLSERHIRDNPPRLLMKLGLIARASGGGRGAYLYTSVVKDYLAREFPGVDEEFLARRLLGE